MSRILSFILLTVVCFHTYSQTKVRGQILPKANYQLSLKVYNLEKGSYLEQKTMNVSNGEFSFEIPAKPNLYKLSMNGQSITLINDNDKEINITIDMNSKPSFTFSGSDASKQYLEYNTLVRDLQVKLLYPFEPKMKKALQENDKNKIALIEKQYKESFNTFLGTLIQKIHSMGSSLAVYTIITDLDFNKYLNQIEGLYQKFLNDKPQSPFTTKLGKLIEAAKLIRVGGKVPDLILETVESNTVSLSKLNSNGKTVLLDFWASWCLPCRKENREFKKMINDYDPNKFVIWSISTDKDKKAWEKAMRKDNMPWMQSRTTDSKIIELFQAITLPTNFLIDQNGIIIAKNIKSSELKALLKSSLKN